MTTAGRVAGVVLPASGVLSILFRAIWYSSVANAGRAAVFIGANQLQVANVNSTTESTAVAEATSGSANVNNWLTTNVAGMASTAGQLRAWRASTR